eukprot:gene18237-23909_t
MKLQGYLTYVGSSSMEVTIDILSADKMDKESLVAQTQFIMVARNPQTGMAAKVPEIIFDSPESIEEFRKGKERALSRKERAASSLSLIPPSNDEIQFMHNLYLDAKDMKIQKNFIIKQSSNSVASEVSKDNNLKKPIDNFKWMKLTEFRSTIFMHYQDRNVHGKIFGGYILKSAFDLAWTTATKFSSLSQYPLVQ